MGDGEKTLLLRVCTALAEGLGSVPSTYTWQLITACNCSSIGVEFLFWALQAAAFTYEYSPATPAPGTHIHIVFKIPQCTQFK